MYDLFVYFAFYIIILNSNEILKSMDKNILFYSNNCQYSCKLIKTLNDERLCHDLVRICVDSGNIRLPSFITSVPTVYISLKKQILTDQRLDAWLKDLQEKQTTKKLAPFCMANNSFSACFSSLDGDDVKNFNFSDVDSGQYHINTPDNDQIQNRKGAGSSDYDRLIEERGQMNVQIRRV